MRLSVGRRHPRQGEGLLSAEISRIHALIVRPHLVANSQDRFHIQIVSSRGDRADQQTVRSECQRTRDISKSSYALFDVRFGVIAISYHVIATGDRSDSERMRGPLPLLCR